MVETYNITINRNQDNFIYSTPFFNMNITLEGEKSESQPEIEGNLPFTKRIVGNELLDLGTWTPGGDNGFYNSLYIRFQNGRITRYSPSVPKCYVEGEGLASQGFKIISSQLDITTTTEYYWNLFWQEPMSTLTITKCTDNWSNTTIRFVDINWTKTRPNYRDYIGYDKSTDTYYGSNLASSRDCEYYSDREISSMFLYTENREITFRYVYVTKIVHASNLIPALKQIN